MMPKIPNGCYVLVHSLWRFVLFQNPVFCFRHEIYGKLIKKVQKKDEEGNYWFESTNEDSLSSFQIGPVKPDNIIGRVVLIIK